MPPLAVNIVTEPKQTLDDVTEEVKLNTLIVCVAVAVQPLIEVPVKETV